MKPIVVILLMLCGLSSIGQTQNKYNLDFEHYDSNKRLADGWFKWSDYDVYMDTISHSGRFSGKISSDENGIEGRIAYTVPANYKGKTIQLEGFMKIKNVEGGFAGLLMRIDVQKMGFHGMNGGFDNMQDQNIKGTKDW